MKKKLSVFSENSNPNSNPILGASKQIGNPDPFNHLTTKPLAENWQMMWRKEVEKNGGQLEVREASLLGNS